MAENTEKKYLDLVGLTEFWGRVKKYIGNSVDGLEDLKNLKINGKSIGSGTNGYTIDITPSDIVVSEEEKEGVTTKTTLGDYIATVDSHMISAQGTKINGTEVFGAEITLNATNLMMSNDENASSIADAIGALATATKFIGIVAELPKTGSNGDIVICGEKEYIYSDAQKDGKDIGWVELGDVTAERADITELQTFILDQTIKTEDLDKLDGLPKLEDNA